MRPDFVGLGGFDSHAFPPRKAVVIVLRRAVAVMVVALIAAAPLRAQAANLRPPISPAKAFFTSALVPGLAQAKLNRSTGMLFAAIEVVSLTMLAKSSHDLATAKALSRDSTPLAFTTDPLTGLAVRDSTGALVVSQWSKSSYDDARVHARKVHVEDWVATLVFNHLFAGLDAFVAAQLWELPAQVEMRATPHGGAIGAKFRW